MADYSGAWSPDRVEAFLEDATVPLRLGCHTPAGGPWLLSLWYRYRDGGFDLATGADAEVVRYLEADPAVAFEVSTNEVPYRGVRGNGAASVAPDEGKATLRALLERYLGGTDSSLAQRLLDPAREEVRIRIEPDRVYSWDFSARMRDV